MKDPNCPKFLESHVHKLREAWEDTNAKAQKRKKELTGILKHLSVLLQNVTLVLSFESVVRE